MFNQKQDRTFFSFLFLKLANFWFWSTFLILSKKGPRTEFLGSDFFPSMNRNICPISLVPIHKKSWSGVIIMTYAFVVEFGGREVQLYRLFWPVAQYEGHHVYIVMLSFSSSLPSCTFKNCWRKRLKAFKMWNNLLSTVLLSTHHVGDFAWIFIEKEKFDENLEDLLKYLVENIRRKEI